MVAILQATDPTLDAVDAAIESRGNAEQPRPYLGMSSIGAPCARASWYGFRWAAPSAFDAATLKRFEDGHRGEDIQAERLRLVPGVTLHTEDPRAPGQQFGFSDIGGHFRGHMDGAILGLVQAPKTWHVWEHKQTGEKKQCELAKLKATNEKSALQAWDATYYAQAVIYMHYAGMDRHYLTCASPGGRHTISVRTNADKAAAEALIEKARRIILADNPPARLSERPDWYQCRWCQFHGICHEGKLPAVNCRTCAHATSELDGDGRWSCFRFKYDLDTATQRQGAQCPSHLFIPSMVPLKQVDASESAGWIEYELSGGGVIRNGHGGVKSRDMKI